MNKKAHWLFILIFLSPVLPAQGWIRINQLGYLPESVKVAVYISNQSEKLSDFALCDAISDKVIFKGKALTFSGEDWGMKSVAKLDFSQVVSAGGYYLMINGTRSDPFKISADVYKGTSDYILRYMRQQRCGYNPYYADSCHTHDGYIVDHPSRSGEVIDVKGGWHDASDYLQYVTTSANAVYQMLFAYSKNPDIYKDNFDRSGNPGANGIPDILDEARWGIDWLLKMNPSAGEMYNQIADDRDHRGFRIPTQDTVSYGKGLYRPVYFVTGKSQGLARYKNRTTGVSSVAGKYASSFAMASRIFEKYDPALAGVLAKKAKEAWDFALTDIGVTQTACNVSPYFYEEDNFADDLELAAWEMFSLTSDSGYLVKADYWGALEPVTPWIEKDTARHYQFYPFVNLGHANIGRAGGRYATKYQSFMKKGLKLLDQRRVNDPFHVTIPFIWCSNNYVAASLTQHRLYYDITGSAQFMKSEAALRDWLFGCNPWGTSMICGLPAGGDYPQYPHAALTFIRKKIPEGGLIDGPVFTSIFKGLKGVGLLRPDEYKDFQNGKVIYHDDIGDYSTNEPTMDGTASLSFILSSLESDGLKQAKEEPGLVTDPFGALIRKNVNRKEIYLIFSADEYGEGLDHILNVLGDNKAKASFFLTGNFVRERKNSDIIRRIIKDEHFVGPHSDKHLLYAAWEKRDSLLLTKDMFQSDLKYNYLELEKHKATLTDSRYFLAPYEWYNSAITSWTADMGVKLINFTPGTGTNADYTTPDMQNYMSSEKLIARLKNFESSEKDGLNGAFVLIHPGTHPDRTDKFYNRLDEIIKYFSSKGYSFNKL
jgi:peptidoglycan/xylan/chitin deacetylase (PgdA/CDA1 family)